MTRVAALCGRDWARAMRASVGIPPATSPPLESGRPGLREWLREASRANLVALNLHGFQHQDSYAGQTARVVGPTALTPSDVRSTRWDGAVIFLEVCFSAADTPGNRAIPRAFYEGGARAVIGSMTEAYGRTRATLPLPGSDGEADRLLSFFLTWYRRLHDPARALYAAKKTLRVWSFPLDREDRATLKSFIIIPKEV